jgi:hypothetical protein
VRIANTWRSCVGSAGAPGNINSCCLLVSQESKERQECMPIERCVQSCILKVSSLYIPYHLYLAISLSLLYLSRTWNTRSPAPTNRTQLLKHSVQTTSSFCTLPCTWFMATRREQHHVLRCRLMTQVCFTLPQCATLVCNNRVLLAPSVCPPAFPHFTSSPYIYKHTYIHTHIHTCVFVCVRESVCVWLHAACRLFTHTHTRTQIHTHTHTNTHTHT